jgi:hypothetical protein
MFLEISKLNIAAELLGHLLRIPEASDSNQGGETGYTD